VLALGLEDVLLVARVIKMMPLVLREFASDNRTEAVAAGFFRGSLGFAP
jgi:hypothetical protein